MATGALSSLGIGSSVLTYDIIEKLRKADEEGQIKPIERKLEENVTRQKDLTQITGYLNSLDSATSSLSSDLLFQGRDVSTSGLSATLSADAGVATGSVSVDVEQLASRDIYQTNAQSSGTTSLGLTAGDFTLSLDGAEHTISVTSSTTLSDLANKINESTNGAIEAKVMNVGGDNPYRLIIQSATTGEEQAITFGGDGAILDSLGLSNLGAGEANEANQLATAQNAIFKYNDVRMERASNTIDDITTGLTLSLSDIGKSTFNITQDKAALAEEMGNFVTAYNDLVNNLDVATDYDDESDQAGSLQGVSQITTIKSSLNRLLTSMDESGRSLSAYGLSLDEGGLLKFNEAALMEKLSQDPTDVEDFFKGMTTYDTTSYTGSGTMSAGALDFNTGDIVINGTSVLFTSDPAATAEQNAQAFRDAINQSGISGVVASLDNTGSRILLNRSDGGEIEISGRSAALSSAGLSTTSIYNEGNTSVGIFSKLEETLEGMLGDRGSLTLYENQLTDSQKRMQTERERTISQLDNKYETMAAQFAAYDSIIANLNNQFSALQSMIDGEANK